MKVLSLLILMTFFLSFSCRKGNQDTVLTYQVRRSDFREVLSTSGTIQAVVNFPVLPPRSMFGQMTVIRLAADGAYVRKGDTICVLSVPDLQSVYERQLSTIQALEADLKKKEADNRLNTGLLEAQLATSIAQFEIAAIDSLRMQYAAEYQKKLYELGIQKSAVERKKTEKKLEATKKIGANELRQINMRLIQERSRLQSMEDQLKAMTIIAQGDGYVTRTEAPEVTIMSLQGLGKLGGPVKEGSVLFMNSPVLQFPDMSRMQVTTQVAESDFRQIEKGQNVTITVDASGELTTTGKVNRKSLIGKANQRYTESRVKSYEVIIDIDSCHSKMKPGLSAACDITTREVKDTLFIPAMALFKRDSADVVYVLEKNAFVPVKIETGETAGSFTIIKSGLEGDEKVALSEPPEKLIRKTRMRGESRDSVKQIINQ
ncbi:MAG: HlyD family efflux transporter periplasmic adaptor subunit [Bacteroidales bacterium]|nr:HlyD family efflux transporter periplasmic adaptor subunit [Bacteroidales bacterium]